MSYDMSGPWSDVAGHHAALHPYPSCSSSSHPGGDIALSASAAVEYCIRQGFPAWKIVLGIPAYAQCFPGARAPGDRFDKESAGLAGQVEYRDLPLRWRENATVDSAVGAAWYVDKDKGFLSFDTTETVRLKADYVVMKGLGGIFFWHGVGDVWGRGSLVSAAIGGLLGQG